MKATDKLIEEMELKIKISKELLDTKELLKKYMNHIMSLENEVQTIFFTMKEIEALKKIEDEILDED